MMCHSNRFFKREPNVVQCTLWSRLFYQFNCYLHRRVNICSHFFKLSYMFKGGSARCSSPSSSNDALQVTRDFRRQIEQWCEGGRKRSGRDNNMLHDYVPAGDFSVMEKLINHTFCLLEIHCRSECCKGREKSSWNQNCNVFCKCKEPKGDFTLTELFQWEQNDFIC